MVRKIIQITRGYLGNDYVDPNTLTALCDDGTLWDLNNGEWTRLLHLKHCAISKVQNAINVNFPNGWKIGVISSRLIPTMKTNCL